jgi:hypothetical protein
MNTEIVIARYNENLNWIEQLDNNIKITIYNKGKNDIKYPFITLPNVGRESHTYLYHIIKNYDNLADLTIFCQGDSIFHSPDFLKLIKKREKFQAIQPLAAFYWPGNVEPNYLPNPPKSILNKTKNLHIDNCQIHVEYLDNEFKTQYPAYYSQSHYIKYVNFIKKEYNVDNVLQFNIDRFNLKNVDLNKLIPICYSGLFAVKKEVILDRSVDFYNNIMSILIYDTRKYIWGELDHGLFLEKLWLLIFNYKKYNKNYLDLNVNDYLLEDKFIECKNNKIKFSIHLFLFELVIHLTVDTQVYYLYIDPLKIVFQHYKKTIYTKEIYKLNKYQKLLAEDQTHIVKLKLKDNNLKMYINKKCIFKIPFEHNIINRVMLKDIAKNNEFKIINKK